MGLLKKLKNTLSDVGQTAAALTGKATSGIAKTVDKAGNAVGNTLQKVGDATGVSGAVEHIGNVTGIKSGAKGLYDAWRAGAGILPQEQEQPLTSPSEQQQQEAAKESSAVNEGMTQAADTAAQEAQANAVSNASAGINKSRAGMLGSQAASQTGSNIQGLYNAAKQQTNTTTNDYLQKMKQADALDTQAKYMQDASNWATLHGVMSGIGNGLQMGAQGGFSLPSDESIKESPEDGIDEEELTKAIKQFKDLYKQVQELKGNK